LTQIIIDTMMGLYNTAFMKFIVATMVTFLLNTLCQRELTVVSWMIVFIPFILMTTIVTILLYVFGLDIAQGKFKKSSPPLPVPRPSSNPINPDPPHGLSENYFYENPPFGTSSPQYESFSLFR
jgi:hypothetical protein